MSLLVRDVMTAPAQTIPASANGYDVAQAMERHAIQHLVVVNRAGEVVGVISDRDVREAQPSTLVVKEHGMRNKALAVMHLADLMSQDPATVEATEPVEDVLRLMRNLKIGCVPVVDDKKKPVGIVTGMDIVDLALRLLGRPH